MSKKPLKVLETEADLVMENGKRLGTMAKHRARRGKGVGKFIVNALKALTELPDNYDAIAANARREFGGVTSRQCVSWYASKLRKGEYGGLPEGHCLLD